MEQGDTFTAPYGDRHVIVAKGNKAVLISGNRFCTNVTVCTRGDFLGVVSIGQTIAWCGREFLAVVVVLP